MKRSFFDPYAFIALKYISDELTSIKTHFSKSIECVTDLDMINLVKLFNGGLVISSSYVILI